MSGFLKTYADAATAKEALRRADALRRGGVQTPAATAGQDPATLVFEKIMGVSGPALIGRDLRPLLRAVSMLHDTPVPGLARFDPMLRIRPRLGLATHRDLRTPPPMPPIPSSSASVTLHGDLHVGQIIVARSGSVWIIDLDDLALGPPEADLANFAAHLATTAPALGLKGWARRICDAWSGLGLRVDPLIFDGYFRLALLRRHLKLREAGRPDFETPIAAYFRESASFSIR